MKKQQKKGPLVTKVTASYRRAPKPAPKRKKMRVTTKERLRRLAERSGPPQPPAPLTSPPLAPIQLLVEQRDPVHFGSHMRAIAESGLAEEIAKGEVVVVDAQQGIVQIQPEVPCMTCNKVRGRAAGPDKVFICDGCMKRIENPTGSAPGAYTKVRV